MAVKTGAERLRANGFCELAGKSVGVIANHNSMAGNLHLCAALSAAPNVQLKTIFSPEHGFAGTAAAGLAVTDHLAPGTTVPVYSLYGDTLAPTGEMLDGIEVLLFDLQDVGARPYTYFSTMGLAMAACAKNNVRFMVLDRPNPLGGEYVAGPVLEWEYRSFVGRYPIPLAHGLSAGELAQMIKGEKWVDGVGQLALSVIEMTGFERWMQWPDTGLGWVPPSPNLPDFETALCYAGTVLFEGTVLSEGRGTPWPFRFIGAPGMDADRIAGEMNALRLPGVRFEADSCMVQKGAASALGNKFGGETIDGILMTVTDRHIFHPVQTAIHLLQKTRRAWPDKSQFFTPDWFAKLAGTELLQQALEGSQNAGAISASADAATAQFTQLRQPYLLY